MTTDSMSSPTIQAEAAGTPSSRGVPTFPTSPVEAAPYPSARRKNRRPLQQVPSIPTDFTEHERTTRTVLAGSENLAV